MERYDRQIKFKQIGLEKQHLLMNKKVGIVGMGALGTHLANSLVRAGVSRLVIVDRDYVTLSNLQRQTLFNEQHVEALVPKVIAAKEELLKINRSLDIDVYIEHCDGDFLNRTMMDCALVLDGTDNFDVRQVINDFCYKVGIPWVYGACVESVYAACPFIPRVTPCFNCVVGTLPGMNRTCDTVGVIEPAVSLATSYQVMYAMKILMEEPFEPKMVFGDVWQLDHTALKFSRMHQTTCPSCGGAPTYPHLKLRNHDTMLCGRDTVQLQAKAITVDDITRFLKHVQLEYIETPYFIRFYFNNHPFMWFRGGRILIHEVTSITEAKNLYYQLFG